MNNIDNVNTYIVKDLLNSSIILPNINNNTTIYELKKQISKIKNININNFFLIYNNNKCYDEKTIGNYIINNLYLLTIITYESNPIKINVVYNNNNYMINNLDRYDIIERILIELQKNINNFNINDYIVMIDNIVLSNNLKLSDYYYKENNNLNKNNFFIVIKKNY